MGDQFGDDAGALLGRLAWPEDRLRHPLAQGPVVIDERPADVGEGQPPQPGDGIVGGDPPGREVVEHRPQRRFLHAPTLPDPGAERPMGV